MSSQQHHQLLTKIAVGAILVIGFVLILLNGTFLKNENIHVGIVFGMVFATAGTLWIRSRARS